MTKNLFAYIWKNTRLEQIWMLIVILVSMVPGYIVLDVTRYIVNGPIQGKGFADGATQTFFRMVVDVPHALSPTGTFIIFSGVNLNRYEALLVLSALFLCLVLVNGALKFYINIYKGRLGERMLQQLRYELFDRIMRFPLSAFANIKSSEVATMIKDEVEPLGGFIGDAFVQPLFLGGQIATTLLFIAVQNMTLFFVTLLMLAIQGFVIPHMRRKQLILSRERQVTARRLAGRIGEVIDDIETIRISGIANYQRADIVRRLTDIFVIRFALYNWKFFIKFLNNLLAQITPFVFFTVGGYFAIIGLIDIGQLVAVISSYKELPSPVKDLIDWDQQRLDVDVKFRQVIEQFSGEELEPPMPALTTLAPDDVLSGTLTLQDVCVQDNAHHNILNIESLNLALDERVALVNEAQGGADILIDVLARVTPPTRGRILLNGRDWRMAHPAAISRQISYVSAEPFFAQGSLYEALVCGLLFQPVRADTAETRTIAHRQSGIINTKPLDLDFKASWLDLKTCGLSSQTEFDTRIRDVLTLVELDHDVIDFGLGCTLPDTRDDQAQENMQSLESLMLEARARFRAMVSDPKLGALVEPFDKERYCQQASILENLVFGTFRNRSFDRNQFVRDTRVRNILRERGLDHALITMGYSIATTIIELFAGLSPDNPLFEQLHVMMPEEFSDYAALLDRLAQIPGIRRSFNADLLQKDDANRLLGLAFNYVEPRERLGLLSDELMTKLVATRAHLADTLAHEPMLDFYDGAQYNPSASIQDNIVFGRLSFGMAGAAESVRAVLRNLIDTLGLRAVVMQAGLSFDIGTAGRRLTRAQREKLELARALLRQPRLLLVRRGLQSVEAQQQKKILQTLIEASRGAHCLPAFGLVWLLDRPEQAIGFERLIIMAHGTCVQDGAALGKGNTPTFDVVEERV